MYARECQCTATRYSGQAADWNKLKALALNYYFFFRRMNFRTQPVRMPLNKCSVRRSIQTQKKNIRIVCRREKIQSVFSRFETRLTVATENSISTSMSYRFHSRSNPFLLFARYPTRNVLNVSTHSCYLEERCVSLR